MSYKGRFWTHYDIDKAVQHTEKHGTCPVCKIRPPKLLDCGHKTGRKIFAITCGETKCRTAWIEGTDRKFGQTGDMTDRDDMRIKIK